MGQYQVTEGNREIRTVASLSGAAMEWAENQSARRVYRIAPSGPVGPAVWQKDSEVTPKELMEALPGEWGNQHKIYGKP
jgi:hypothetical protein